MTHPKRTLRKRLALALGATLVALALGELAARILEPTPDKRSLHRTLLDRPYLYGLDPSHPEVSSQGLRDREFAIPKPPGTRRILLLGDSVVYGVGVPRDATLSRALENALSSRGHEVEVVNSGCHGWSTYNQLHFYRDHGHAFGADLVVLVFCLNDIVDPRLHWRYSQGLIPSIPDAAIPNLEYSRTHSTPILEDQRDVELRRRSFPWSTLRRSALFRKIAKLLEPGVHQPRREVDGRTWPLRLTGEDDLSIDVLMDPKSTEWVWLGAQLTALHDAVRAQSAEFLLTSVPLAYQLDPEYPYDPQDELTKFAAAKGIDYVAALPALRGKITEDMFLGFLSGYDDIWHLSVEGLQVVAERYAEHIATQVIPRLK